MNMIRSRGRLLASHLSTADEIEAMIILLAAMHGVCRIPYKNSLKNHWKTHEVSNGLTQRTLLGALQGNDKG